MQTNLLSQKHGMEHQAPGHAETQVCNSTFILLFFVTFRILVSGRKSEQVQGVPENNWIKTLFTIGHFFLLKAFFSYCCVYF